MVDGLRERDKLRATMGKYMTQAVMDHLLNGKLELGGEPLTVTILFSDIRAFTSISEAMSAQELVKLLNEYFTEMVAVIMEEGVSSTNTSAMRSWQCSVPLYPSRMTPSARCARRSACVTRSLR